MANHHKLQFWMDNDGNLNLYHQDNLTGEFDLWYVFDGTQWFIEAMDSQIPVTVEDELRKLLDNLKKRAEET